MADEKINPFPTIDQTASTTIDGAPPIKHLKHTHDADEALKVFEGQDVIELDEATNKRLLRKIDANIMPVQSVLHRSVRRG